MVSARHGGELAGAWGVGLWAGDRSWWHSATPLPRQSRDVQEVWAGAPALGCRCCLVDGRPENRGVFLAHPVQGLGSSGSSLPI